MKPIERTLSTDLEHAESVLREQLGDVGFGVLTEIDVAEVFRTKLDVDRPPLKILGACNPSLAKRALEIDPDAALVLPCNITLETHGNSTRVCAVDPRELMADHALRELADEAAERLTWALDQCVIHTVPAP